MKSGSVLRFYYGLVCRYWVSHMGLTKTMPEILQYTGPQAAKER